MSDSEGSTSKVCRALIVEDSVTIQKIHQGLLKKLGVIETQCVGNGKEAVDIHCKLGRQFFKLILMDMDMPIMNGIEATKRLRAMDIRSMIAGVSTRSSEEEIQEFKEGGLDDYLEKPLTMPKLASVLNKMNHNR